MVLLKSKIRWLALMGVALSALSLATHFLLARFFASDGAIAAAASTSKRDVQAFIAWRSSDEDRSHGKAWSPVKEFRGLRPYAAPRKAYPPPTGVGNGYLFARIYGEFHEIRASICDLVVVARLLNATLVLPELQEVTSAKGISSKFKGFGYIFNEQHFITALKRDVVVVKNTPEKFKAAKRQKTLTLKSPSSSSSAKMYLNEVLPALKSQGAVSLMISGGGCLQSVLPPHLVEYQRLRCRVAFEALQFRHEVQELGSRMVQRLQALGQPYLAFHTGLERDSLAFHGCAERFQDVHTQLIQYKRALMIKEGLVIGNLGVDSELQWQNGSCPLMPEEVGVLLRALGYGPHTRIYISGAEVFGGQRVLIPLRAMFSNLEDRTTLTTAEERAMMYGPEEALPPPPPPPPPPSPDDVKRMIAAWQVAGPRPRPLPPPPGRNIYTHELEGWWGWVANSDKEPPPSIADLRRKGHKLLWAALDYIVCVESTAFFPGFDRDGKGRPNFASMVMGHRAYMSPSLRTYRPNRKETARLLQALGDKLYHPKWSWVRSARDNLTASMGDAGLTMANHNLKPDMFLSNPLPECTCRLTEHPNASLVVKQDRKHRSLSGDDACPSWMENDTEAHWTGDVDEEQEVETGTPEEAELADTGSEGDEPVSVSLDKVDKEDVQTEGEEDDTSD